MSYRIIDSKEETIRGFIYNDDRLVCKTFPYSDELVVENIEEIKTRLSEGEWSFFPSYEGTIIRIVNDGDNQFVSTHKKLDAFSSRWGSEHSFGDLFKNSITEFNKTSDNLHENAYDEFLKTLKDNNHHTFLLCSNLDSRIVANRDNEVFYVGSFNRETHEFLGILEDIKDKLSNFCKSTEKLDITVDDILDYVENKVDPFSQQGLVAIRKKDMSIFKVINSTYKNLSELRGNNPSLSNRYLELLLKQKSLVLDFCTIFSNKQHEFGYLEELLDNTVHYILNVIRRRYLHKRYMHVSPVIHSFVKLFEKNTDVQDITFEHVFEKLQSVELDYIWKLMHSYLENSS